MEKRRNLFPYEMVWSVEHLEVSLVGTEDESLACRRYPADAVETGNADVGALAEVTHMQQHPRQVVLFDGRRRLALPATVPTEGRRRDPVDLVKRYAHVNRHVSRRLD